MPRIIGILLLLLMALLSDASTLAAQPATIVVTTVENGSFDLQAQRGKWVIVNWWATWCSACLEEMPNLSKFVATHKDVVAIGLTDEDISAEALRAFVIAHPVGYPVAQLSEKLTPREFKSSAYGMQMRPITYLVDPAGKVVKRMLGGISLSKLDKIVTEQIKP
ncbi:TlpA disulfide reductase family protein [Dokdonella soli]|uniref:Thioredoxin domain-containing protein n=1 Tax=Dokdonella soli TaxID=529810 RepID=A0ABP3TJG5_9GAMM